MPVKKCEFYLAINEDNDFVVGAEKDDVLSQLNEEGGELVRLVKLTVTLAQPQIIEVALNVPDTAGETSKVETEVA